MNQTPYWTVDEYPYMDMQEEGHYFCTECLAHISANKICPPCSGEWSSLDQEIQKAGLKRNIPRDIIDGTYRTVDKEFIIEKWSNKKRCKFTIPKNVPRSLAQFIHSTSTLAGEALPPEFATQYITFLKDRYMRLLQSLARLPTNHPIYQKVYNRAYLRTVHLENSAVRKKMLWRALGMGNSYEIPDPELADAELPSLSTRVPHKTYAAYKKLSDSTGMSMSVFMRRALADYLINNGHVKDDC